MTDQLPDWSGAIARASAHAPFLAGALNRMPALVALLAAGDAQGALALARAAGAGAPDTGAALRREKQALSLALAIGDLAGAFPLLDITGALSAFADRALDAAIDEGIRRRVPDFDPQSPRGFFALALGKHGAGELNYSSDIDPILLFDPALLPRRSRDEPGEAAQRVARIVVETLSRVDHEGYVFRVDLRLRPASEVSPLAIPIEAALTHYESSALTWERAAFIRARACAGDVDAGEAFLAAIRPFVWRRSLDFGAIAEIGRLTAQIRASTHSKKGGSAHVGPGFDLKKGRGGIREVEFYAQTHQLIHGGRNPALRLRGTRATLDALATAGLIPPDDATLLGESYDRLRTIEHRLQMVQDQQTHSLPQTAEAIDAVARLDGLASGNALIAELTAITDAVGARYDALIMANTPCGSVPVAAPDQSSLADELEGLGFEDPDALAERIRGWLGGRVRALRSDPARRAFEAVRPALLAALAAAPAPKQALARWEQLLGNLPSAINLFNLLEARPALLDLLVRILGLAPPLADALARRADLLDPLIDASAFDLPGPVADLIADLRRYEAGDDFERKLDAVRLKVGEMRFKLGAQLIEGANDPIAIGRGVARIAEAALVVLTDATVEEFRARHGTVPDSELLVLGLGRMGGGVLTHASDLDLVYLFSGDFAAQSDGERPLGATHYYNRLAQRAISALSVATAQGALFEVDTRLRPSGEQGPPAASLDSFARYQHEQAWTWEHMALCRARPLYGSEAARAALSAVVHQVLTTPRDPVKLRADVLDMRETMARHKPAKGLLDVKLARGGLVDLEFIIHYIQLREHGGPDGAGLDPDLGQAVRVFAAAGLVPSALVDAHDELTRLLVAGRLLAPDVQQPGPAACMALVRACGYDDWNDLVRGLARARDHVAQAWHEAFGQTLETR